MAQATASKQAIPLGGLLWHGQEGFSRSAFEHTSFASKEDIIKAFRNFLGVQLEDTVFESILDEYESVCQLRHGIAHGDGLLPGRNAVNLDIPKYGRPVRIVVRYAQLQEVASVATTLVATLNRFLFEANCRRWAIDWRKREDWDPTHERKRFSVIWRLFHSKEDIKTRKGKSKISMQKCMATVKGQYNI